MRQRPFGIPRERHEPRQSQLHRLTEPALVETEAKLPALVSDGERAVTGRLQELEWQGLLAIVDESHAGRALKAR